MIVTNILNLKQLVGKMYKELLEGLELNNLITASEKRAALGIIVDEEKTLFNLREFENELINNSYNKNKGFADNTKRFNAYDIAHNCIRTVIFRMLGYPVKTYKDKWLPVALRAKIGQACHDFVQKNSSTFTEQEVYLRIPSIHTSVKIDALINHNVLVEIKSCPYKDYSKIIKTRQARPDDLKQAITYSYLIEEHIEESRNQRLEHNRYNLPKLNNYFIETVQMIYVCHELFAADATIAESVKDAAELRKKLNSKYKNLWMLDVLNYDVNTKDYQQIKSDVKEKIEQLNIFFANKKIPQMSNKFIDKKKCFFCLYGDVCKKCV